MAGVTEQHLFCDDALLPAGWAHDVRITIAAGTIAAVEADATPAPGDARHGCALPGLPNLHSHAFQRGMAGLAERRGPAGDSFWQWREPMYRFLDRMTPDDLRAVATLASGGMIHRRFPPPRQFH